MVQKVQLTKSKSICDENFHETGTKREFPKWKRACSKSPQVTAHLKVEGRMVPTEDWEEGQQVQPHRSYSTQHGKF